MPSYPPESGIPTWELLELFPAGHGQSGNRSLGACQSWTREEAVIMLQPKSPVPLDATGYARRELEPPNEYYHLSYCVAETYGSRGSSCTHGHGFGEHEIRQVALSLARVEALRT